MAFSQVEEASIEQPGTDDICQRWQEVMWVTKIAMVTVVKMDVMHAVKSTTKTHKEHVLDMQIKNPSKKVGNTD